MYYFFYLTLILSEQLVHNEMPRYAISTKISVWLKCILSYSLSAHGRIQTGGGQGVRTPPPPKKSQKYRFSLQYWSGSPEKSQSYQASNKCWAIICPPAKRHFNGVKWHFAAGLLMVQLKRFLDPLSPHQQKKNVIKFGPPLTKLIKSAHAAHACFH